MQVCLTHNKSTKEFFDKFEVTIHRNEQHEAVRNFGAKYFLKKANIEL